MNNDTFDSLDPRATVLAAGTWLQGYVNASYYELVQAFGPPLGRGDGYKTRCEWVLAFDDGAIATIYDWKKDEPVEQVMRWNVGGRNPIATEHVLEVLNKCYYDNAPDLDPYAGFD